MEQFSNQFVKINAHKWLKHTIGDSRRRCFLFSPLCRIGFSSPALNLCSMEIFWKWLLACAPISTRPEQTAVCSRAVRCCWRLCVCVCAYFCARHAFLPKRKTDCLAISILYTFHSHWYKSMQRHFNLTENAEVNSKTKSKSKFYSFVICSFLLSFRFGYGVFFVVAVLFVLSLAHSLTHTHTHIAHHLTLARSGGQLVTIVWNKRNSELNVFCGSCTFTCSHTLSLSLAVWVCVDPRQSNIAKCATKFQRPYSK